MQHKIHKKAYVINLNNVSEPWHYNDFVFYADTVGKAKAEALNEAYGIVNLQGDELTFTTISLKRAPQHDRYIVDGREVSMADIQYKKDVDERDADMQRMVDENPDGFAYIIKRGSYYCSNYSGYTSNWKEAGVYPIKDAALHVKGCSLDGNMHIQVININERNKSVLQEIDRLNKSLIPCLNKLGELNN